VTSGERELQDSIVDHARDVMDKSANLIEEAKKAVAQPQNPDNQTRLAQVCVCDMIMSSLGYIRQLGLVFLAILHAN